MAFTESRVFQAFVKEGLDNTYAFDLGGDSFLVGLFDNTLTPDRTVATAATIYDAGVWLVAAEESDGTEWDAGGEPLVSPLWTAEAAGVCKWDATDTVSGGSSATLSPYGCAIFDSTVTVRGVCYNYFGAQVVTNGTFTVVWNTAGIFTLTV